MNLLKEVLEQGVWFPTPRSSNIVRLRFLKESSTLVIQFSSGAHYRYEAVPESLVAEMINSPSQGKFFYARIRSSFPGIKCESNYVPIIPPPEPQIIK